MPGRPSDADPETLRTVRLLCAITMVAYPAFWVTDAMAGATVQDPLALRILMSALCAWVWVGTYRSPWVRAHVQIMMLAVACFITANAHFLVTANDLHQTMVVGCFVVLTGFIATAPITIGRPSDIAAYVVFTNTCAVVSVLLTERPQTNPAYYLLSIATVSSLALVAMRGQFLTSRRLAESETLLLEDVGQRKRTEAALRASEAQASALLRAVPDIMIRLDARNCIEAVVSGADCELKALLSGAAGRPFAEVLTDGNGHDTLQDALAATRSQPAGRTVMAAATLPSGTRQLHVSIVPIDADHVLVLVRDITDVQELEAQLQLRDRLVSLGTLAGGVAHEINNPLTYVCANLAWVEEQLRAGRGDLPTPELVEALAEARTGSYRIRDIVADLQRHGHAEEHALGPVDISDCIQSALRVMDNQIKHSAVLDVSLADLPPVHANHSRLHQVMLNLIGNALQAFPERPPTQNLLKIHSLELPNGRVRIEVVDNGDGIPPQIQARIFDPFFTTKMPGVGTGLGLYLCHKFVTASGGDLRVESSPGRGTKFIVTLTTAQHAQAFSEDRRPASFAALRVLVIDDEPLVARSVVRMLRGHEVDVAHSCEEALRLLARAPYSVILCDLMMPVCDGSEFYTKLSERHPELASRVLFMSGGAFKAHLERFIRDLPNPLLEKPIDPEELADNLRHVAPRGPIHTVHRASRPAGVSATSSTPATSFPPPSA